jgi:hypothetical protein
MLAGLLVTIEAAEIGGGDKNPNLGKSDYNILTG